MRNKKIIQNAFSLGVVQLVNLGLPLISLPYLASVLGAEQLGRVAFALSVAQILVILTDYGFNLSAPKAVSINRNNPHKVAEIWCAVTLIRAFLALVGIACIGISALIFERARSELGLFTAAYVMVIGNVILPQWLFQGLEKLKEISIIQVFARIIVFSIIFLLVKTTSDIYWATLLQAAGYLLGGILALPYTFTALKGGQLRWPSQSAIKEQLKEGWHVFLSSAAVNIYTSCNTFFLGLIATPVAVGQFHIAEKLIRAVQALYNPISNAIYPHVSRLAVSDPVAALRFNQKLVYILGAISVIASLSIYFIAPYAVRIVFGPDYSPAAEILKIFSLLPLITVISNIFGIQTMLPLGMESTFSRVLLGAALINFAIYIPAVYVFNGVGAAWANVSVELFVTISMGVLLHSAGRNPFTFNHHKQ